MPQRFPHLIVAIVVVCLVFLVSTAARQQVFDVRSLISNQDFAAAGLHKLSDRELEALNNWLGSFTVDSVSALVSSSPTPTGDVIESQIDREFEG